MHFLGPLPNANWYFRRSLASGPSQRSGSKVLRRVRESALFVQDKDLKQKTGFESRKRISIAREVLRPK